MKIVKIRLQNINSLKGIHEIDFSSQPLAASGLFAITGPTGSGKTTILDAITLGLYNQVPRAGKISRNSIVESGVILTRNTLEGFAEITYECSKGTFVSKWSISTARTGNLQDYQMEIAPADTLVPLDIKKGNVPNKNSELIGLNYEQFIRAIMLAQGEFSKFLEAKEDERGKLLEQITGGEIYRKLGMKAFEMFKLHGEELDTKIQLRDGHREMLMEKETFDEKMKRLAEVEKELTALQTENEQLQEAINLKGEIERSESSLQSLKEQLSEKKTELESFNKTEGEKLNKHIALVPIHEPLQQWKNAKKEAATIEEDTRRVSGVVSNLNNEISELKSTIAALTKDTQSDPPVALDAFREKVMDLDAKIKSETVTIGQKQETLRELASRTGLEYDPDRLSDFETLMAERIETDQKEINALKDELGKDAVEEPVNTLKALRSVQEKVNEISIASGNLETLQKNKEDIRLELESLSEQVSALPDRIKSQEAKAETAKLQRDNLRLELENRNLRASMEEHRKQLVPGKPCPLCGALEHPLFKDEDKGKDQLAGNLAQSEQELQKETASLEGLKADLRNKKERVETLSAQQTESEKKITGKKQEISAIKDQLPSRLREKEPTIIKEQVRSDIASLERYIELTRLHMDLVNIPKNLEVLKQASGQREVLSKGRHALFEGNDVTRTTNDLGRQWDGKNTDLRNQSERLTEYREKREAILKQIRGYDLDILKVIHPLGYEKAEDALSDLLAPDIAERLRRRKDEILDGIKKNETETKVITDRIDELRSKDREEQKEKLQEILDENRELMSVKKEERDDLVSKKRTQEEYSAKIATLNQAIEKLEKENLKWKLLRELIGDREGKKFSTFAQRLTLYKLIGLANKRLRVLNDRYLLDLPKEEEDDSLSVIDTHMGDQRRSVKSLSGGETFLISLALALALSDLAARNIRINSLFIDEGFGSLDKLTLDQTIDTLEKLQYESGKSIGVISHVEAMQERITTQIKVSKNGQGYSSVKVIT